MAPLIPSYTGDNEFPAYQDRLLMRSLVQQPGVVGRGDCEVVSGSGLQVYVKPGKAFVEQTNAVNGSFYNGLYNCLNSSESNPYNSVEVYGTPQIAQIVLRVYDVEELKISGSSYARIEWVNGAPTSNATKTKMEEGKYEGAASLPTSSLRLSRVLVPANATSSSEFYIEDARTWSGVGKYLNVLNINSKIESGVGVRTEFGAVTRFGGTFKALSNISASTALFTLPPVCRPPYPLRVCTPNLITVSLNICLVNVNGIVENALEIKEGNSISFDGATFLLNTLL